MKAEVSETEIRASRGCQICQGPGKKKSIKNSEIPKNHNLVSVSAESSRWDVYEQSQEILWS